MSAPTGGRWSGWVAFLLLCWLIAATLFGGVWLAGRRGDGDGDHHP